jgi:hypothetical protein
VTVSVGVPTRGDRDLRPLLDALTRQRPSGIVVVCNAAQAPAALRDACAQSGAVLVTEPRKGFASARNALLHAARTQECPAPLLAMIDDDELPADGWLDNLLDVHRRTGAAAVLGPVVTRWSPSTPAYIRRADLPRRRRNQPTGTVVDDGITGNCLLHLPSLKGLEFETSFDTSGGEDSRFFRELRLSLGGAIVWANDAVAYEEPDTTRLSVRSLCARSYRNGATARQVASSSRARVLLANHRRLVKAALLFCLGIAAFRRDLLLRAGWEVAYVAGILAPARAVRSSESRGVASPGAQGSICEPGRIGHG